MRAVRSIVSDLVERRLWPVAVVLLAAVIAIPVLLVKPASKAPAPTKVAGTPAPAPGTPAVSLAEPEGGPVVGRMHNPFRQQHLPKMLNATGKTSALGPATPGGGGKGSTGTSSSGGSSGGGGSGGSGGAPPRRSVPRTVLEVRFGLADGKRTKREVSAGSPLPSATNPLLVYLGQTKRGSAFLVSSDAQPQGDGRCEPDKSICSTLYLRAGDTEFFDVTGPAGTVQYELEVLRVRTSG